MKVSEDYIMREIAGEYILVPMGAAAANFNGLISMNETGKFVVEQLSREHHLSELVERMIEEYDVSRENAQADLERFLQQLREIGALVEEHP